MENLVQYLLDEAALWAAENNRSCRNFRRFLYPCENNKKNNH